MTVSFQAKSPTRDSLTNTGGSRRLGERQFGTSVSSGSRQDFRTSCSGNTVNLARFALSSLPSQARPRIDFAWPVFSIANFLTPKPWIGRFMSRSTVELVAPIIREAKNIVVFTGAGMSAESNIPTFRDDDGFWKRFPVEHFATWQGISRTAFRRCLLYTSPSPRDATLSRMPSSA